MAIADDSSGRRVTQRGYLLAYLAVAGLVVASFALAHLPLGWAALPVALAIATAQTVVVALWFMHLVEERGARRFVLPVSVSLLLLLLALVFADVGGRYAPVRPGAIPHQIEPRPAGRPQTAVPDVTPGERIR